jgi:hypothetical protein
MARSLLKHLPEFLGRGRREFFTPLQAPITMLCGFFQGGQLLGRGAVFSLGVVGRLDGDFTKGDDVGAADDADVLSQRPRFFFASVIVRVFIKTLYRLNVIRSILGDVFVVG